jgi:hypothetical protein
MSRIVGSYVLKCSSLASTAPLPATTVRMAGAIKKAAFCLRPPALAASSRKCGLCWEFQFGRGAVRATRSFSQVLAPVTSQWSESEPQQGRGVEQADGAKTDFPRPPTVVWSKELANRVHFIGRLGRDMEVKYLDTGKVVAKSSLAVKRSSKKDDAPSWYTCFPLVPTQAWGSEGGGGGGERISTSNAKVLGFIFPFGCHTHNA